MTWDLNDARAWMNRTMAYALAILSAAISLLLYLELIGQKLSGALIPQSISTPCSLFFLALALIFAAFGLAEQPLAPPDHGIHLDEGEKDE